MSASKLQAALAHAGLAADVEGRDRLALIRAADAAAMRAIAARRAEVMTAAMAQGFTHVALEVASRQREHLLGSHAALPGD